MGGGLTEFNRVKGMRIEMGMHTLFVEQKIAGGAFGDVWKCRDAATGATYAAKEIKIQSEELEAMYEKEVLWLERLAQVEGIIRYIGSKKIHSMNRNR
jgi:hypothetical protein